MSINLNLHGYVRPNESKSDSSVNLGMALGERSDEFGERDQAKGIDEQRNGAARSLLTCPGAYQSVHSRGIANEPRSAWRRLNVSTPETWRTFKTTNRCPRNG